jgi:hypothetical protein
MNGIEPFLCLGCQHDIELHIQTSAHYEPRETCMGKLSDGTRCSCDGFRIRVSSTTAAAVAAAKADRR